MVAVRVAVLSPTPETLAQPPVALVGATVKATPMDGSDPSELPLPRITPAAGYFPTVKGLPVRTQMLDPPTFADGSVVTTREQWQNRREEMKRLLAHYATGQMPPLPGNVTF